MAHPAVVDLVENRGDQIFPTLTAAEIERIRRLGERRAYPAEAHIFTTSAIAPAASPLQTDFLSVRMASGRTMPLCKFLEEARHSGSGRSLHQS